MRDSIRDRIGRRIVLLGRYIANGGKPHEWQQDLIRDNEARCRRCNVTAHADMVLRHGGLVGRCPRR